jgi:UPF0755 protein
MPQGPQAPYGSPGFPRLPDRETWRPDEHLRPLSPGSQPGSQPRSQPGRRTQPPPRPETAQPWRPGPPVQSSHDPGDRYDERGQHGEPGSHREYPEYPQYAEPAPYPGDGENQDRFVPGFGDPGHDDGDDEYEEYAEERPSRRRHRDDGRPPRGGGRRRFRWIAPLAALLVIVVPLAIGGVYGYNLYMSKYHPADYSGNGTGSLVVQVASGDSPTSLAPKLMKLGVVASTRAFILAAEHSTSGAGLLPGFYGMHEHMKASLAYALLVNPANMVQVKVTIPEGWRLSQTTSYLGAKSGITASAYAKALKDPAALGLPSFANGKPEGYLFPATYAVVPHESATGVLKAMVKAFNAEAVKANLITGSQHVGLTPGQVITMASLVQAEGGRLADYPKIARVIYNRLKQGIPLELDSTVLYGLDTFGIIATNKQLQSPSPYNTYKHKGLTPGPIDSPGHAAIEAVLHPATGNWIYFVTVNPKTGETKFTSSQQQFLQFRQELEQNLAKK